jgi:hypothetical protein
VEIVGLKLVTHHPVIEPVSAPRQEAFRLISGIADSMSAPT